MAFAMGKSAFGATASKKKSAFAPPAAKPKQGPGSKPVSPGPLRKKAAARAKDKGGLGRY